MKKSRVHWLLKEEGRDSPKKKRDSMTKNLLRKEEEEIQLHRGGRRRGLSKPEKEGDEGREGSSREEDRFSRRKIGGGRHALQLEQHGQDEHIKKEIRKREGTFFYERQKGSPAM